MINKTAIEGSTNIPGQSQSIKPTYNILIQLNLGSLGVHLSEVRLKVVHFCGNLHMVTGPFCKRLFKTYCDDFWWHNQGKKFRIYGNCFAFQETLPGAPLLRHLLKQLLVFPGKRNF